MSTKIKDLTALTTVDGTEEIPVHDPNEAVAANGTKKITLNKIITFSKGVGFNGGGSAITTGVKGSFRVPVNCTIIKVTIAGDIAASASVEVTAGTLTDWNTSSMTSIDASAPPTLSGGNKIVEDSTLTGWSKNLIAGDIVECSTTTITGQTQLAITFDLRAR